MATITFDQTGLAPPGVTDRARTDGLSDGSQVTVTVSPPGGIVEFVAIPSDDTTSVSSLAQFNSSTWNFSPTAGVYGSWLVKYVVSGQEVRRVFATRYPKSGLRAPAFNEKAAITATIANGSSYVDVSDDNEGGTYQGYAPEEQLLFRVVDQLVSDKVTQSVTSGPSTVTAGLNSVVFVDVSGGAVTVNLPAGHVAGDKVTVKLASTATNSCTIDPNGAETIDGVATLNLAADYEWATLISNGSNWFQIS